MGVVDRFDRKLFVKCFCSKKTVDISGNVCGSQSVNIRRAPPAPTLTNGRNCYG